MFLLIYKLSKDFINQVNIWLALILHTHGTCSNFTRKDHIYRHICHFTKNVSFQLKKNYSWLIFVTTATGDGGVFVQAVNTNNNNNYTSGINVSTHPISHPKYEMLLSSKIPHPKVTKHGIQIYFVWGQFCREFKHLKIRQCTQNYKSEKNLWHLNVPGAWCLLTSCQS